MKYLSAKIKFLKNLGKKKILKPSAVLIMSTALFYTTPAEASTCTDGYNWCMNTAATAYWNCDRPIGSHANHCEHRLRDAEAVCAIALTICNFGIPF